MITLIVDHCKPISQANYDEEVNSVQIHTLICPHGHKGCCSRYGRYKRSIHTEEGKLSLSIARVWCSACAGTHALFLSTMVPYSQLPRDVQAAIIQHYDSDHCYDTILDTFLSLDLHTVHSVVRSFNRHWRQRCLSAGISIFDLHSLTSACFRFFKRQFMQIKIRCNSLFPSPT